MNDPAPVIANASVAQGETVEFPNGDIGKIAQFIMEFAHHPDRTIALAGALAIYAGIVGGGYQTPSGASLNVYVLLLAPTGQGKDIVKLARAAIYKAIVDQGYAAIVDTIGPGEVASGPALIRWWEKKPCCLSILPEFAPTLRKITAPNANVNDEGIRQKLLMGYGSVIDPSAYADETKNTKFIDGLAYSIFAESVPETIYEKFDERLITSGLLPRFDLFETNARRSYHQKHRIKAPPQELANHLANVGARAASNRTPIVPTFEPGAESKLDEFERWVTDQINGSRSEVKRHLWNRANLKAQKLASLSAVGENYLQPVITLEGVMWATNLVVNQTLKLLGKFDNGEVGEEVGNQAKQRALICRLVKEFIGQPFDKAKAYGQTEKMHTAQIVTHSYLQKRVFTLPAFKPKPTQSLTDIIKTFLDAHELQEVPVQQMQQSLETRAKAYKVIKRAAFDLPSYFDD